MVRGRNHRSWAVQRGPAKYKVHPPNPNFLQAVAVLARFLSPHWRWLSSMLTPPTSLPLGLHKCP